MKFVCHRHKLKRKTEEKRAIPESVAIKIKMGTYCMSARQHKRPTKSMVETALDKAG